MKYFLARLTHKRKTDNILLVQNLSQFSRRRAAKCFATCEQDFAIFDICV